MPRNHWQDWLVMAVGLILLLIPFGVSYALPPETSAIVVRTAFVLTGLAVLLLGAIGVASETTWGDWAIIALGLWLIAAPWLLRFGTAGSVKWMSLAAGVIAIILAGLSIVDRRSET